MTVYLPFLTAGVILTHSVWKDKQEMAKDFPNVNKRHWVTIGLFATMTCGLYFLWYPLDRDVRIECDGIAYFESDEEKSDEEKSGQKDFPYNHPSFKEDNNSPRSDSSEVQEETEQKNVSPHRTSTNAEMTPHANETDHRKGGSRSSSKRGREDKSAVLERLRNMDPYEFEEQIADIRERNGWDVEVTNSSVDKGVDIIATKEDAIEKRRHLIQVKRHGENTKVGSADIQQYASLYLRDEPVDNVIIVTSNRFTKEAKEVADSRDVSTVNCDELYEMLSET